MIGMRGGLAGLTEKVDEAKGEEEGTYMIMRLAF
jgi:hypothetical protein